MLGALKRLFGRGDGAAAAPPGGVAAIPAQYEEVAAGGDAGIRLRRQYELSPEAVGPLLAIGMPEDIGRLAYHAEPTYDFPLREPDTPKMAARRCLVFMRAMSIKGAFRVDDVTGIYEDFCTWDHRKPADISLFLNQLANSPGVTKKRPQVNGVRDPQVMYFIKPRPFSKAIGQAPKTPTTETLPDNVVRMPAVARAMTHEERRYGRRRHRKNFHPGRRVA